MKQFALPALVIALSLGPAVAEGDAEAGEKAFNRCKSCHSITNGEEVILRGGRTGPDLFGVIGRPAASVEEFKYSNDLVAAAEAGLIWNQENLVDFATDPRAFLREYLGDGGAKSKMTFRLSSGGEDIAAYLVSLAPATAPEPAQNTDTADGAATTAE